MFAVMLFTNVRSDVVFLSAVGILYITGVLDAKEALSVLAEKLGYEPYPFLIALMIAVSSSFATPIGSPTHMLVYGPGGYRFGDFLKIGILMNLIILAANILIVNLIYPLTPLNL